MTTLEQQIRTVSEKREKVSILQKAKDALYATLEYQYKESFEALASAKAHCSEAEQTLRELILQAYRETGNKAPAPGVGIRIITNLIYDATKALEWAKQHGLALKLDTSAFEKIAKVDKPDFVEMAEEPQATIATDLSKVLQEEK